MKTDRLIILNEVERPCMHLICRIMPNGKINYVSKFLRRRFPKLRRSRGWDTLENFGFVYKNGYFILQNKSKSKYNDGTIRNWQGYKKFTYKDIMNSTKISE